MAGNSKKKQVRKQPRKDNGVRRVNYDNTRVDKFEKDLSKVFDRKDSNDIRWYSKNSSALEGAARLPFASISGLTMPSDLEMAATPGVAVLQFTPTFTSNTAIMMQAYNATYSNIVHANSRNQSYDATDLAIMMNAGWEIFSAIAAGIRVYGLMKLFTEPNLYTPRMIIEGAGFNYDDLKANYSHMFSDLEQLITQSRQIWLPNSMPILERRFWMNTYVYQDAETTKSQYYLYRQSAFYKYQGYTDKRGGKLVEAGNQFSVGSYTWSAYRQLVQGMIDAIIPDQDRGIMFGDILKAYGPENLFAIKDLALDYKTTITYNREVLWQIENATMCQTRPIEVIQENGRLVTHWNGFKYQNAKVPLTGYSPNYAILNFHQNEQPSSAQIAVATRCISLGNAVVDNYVKNSDGSIVKDGETVVPRIYGTEIVSNVIILYNKFSTYNGPATRAVLDLSYWKSASYTIPLLDLQQYIAFDWAPIVYRVKEEQLIIDGKFSVALCEYDNWIKLSQSELEQLNNPILNSLYDVPMLK